MQSKSSIKRTVFDPATDDVRFDPIAVKGLTTAAGLPVVKDWFIFGVDCHVRRPD